MIKCRIWINALTLPVSILPSSFTHTLHVKTFLLSCHLSHCQHSYQHTAREDCILVLSCKPLPCQHTLHVKTVFLPCHPSLSTACGSCFCFALHRNGPVWFTCPARGMNPSSSRCDSMRFPRCGAALLCTTRHNMRQRSTAEALAVCSKMHGQSCHKPWN